MSDSAPPQNDAARFRTTLLRVLVMQVLALAVLALLQMVYGN